MSGGLRTRWDSYEPRAERPAVGSTWTWEPNIPRARESVTVTAVLWNGDEWWVHTTGDGGERWNDLGRFWEACWPEPDPNAIPVGGELIWHGRPAFQKALPCGWQPSNLGSGRDWSNLGDNRWRRVAAPEPGAPVQHTGILEYRIARPLAAEERTRGERGAAGADDLHRREAAIALEPQLLDAVSDGRRYVVTMDMDGPTPESIAGRPFIVRSTRITLLLVDPHDAHVGEAVWREPPSTEPPPANALVAWPGRNAGRPDQCWADLSDTSWDKTPDSWIRTT